MYLVNPEDITEVIDTFITIKDPHANFGFANRIRYTHNEDLSAKFDFVREQAIKRKINKVFATGDLTDSNDEKKWSFKQYFLNKQELLRFRGDYIELYSIAGNHDMFNGMEKTDETVFGELVNENVVNYFTLSPIITTFKKPNGEDHNIVVFGVDYSKHKEVIEKRLKEIDDFKMGDITKIVVIHAHVTPAEITVTDFTYEYLIKTYTTIDAYICGHYHGGFPTQAFYKKDLKGKDDTTGHVLFINDWSMQRVVRDYYNEMNVHTPEFSIVKFGWSHAYDKLIVSTEKVGIPHKSYEEAFKPKVIDLLKLTRKEHFEFFEKINFDEIPTGNDDMETIAKIAERENVDNKIVVLAIKYLNNIETDVSE